MCYRPAWLALRSRQPLRSAVCRGNDEGIRVAGLRKTFGKVRAVHDVSFEVPAGSLITLLGPSGCGKTTTLRLIAGLERPDAGEVHVGGRLLTSAAQGVFLAPDKRQMGMVFQTYAIWPHMTVFENVAFPLRARRVPARDIRERVMAMLQSLGLDGFEDRPAPLLSGGQQQRVALGRALVANPDVLLLDEPFSNLDARLREEMRFELKELQTRVGVTTLFVTHDQTEALILSDRVLVMNAGRIAQEGAPRQVYEHPRTPFIMDVLGQVNHVSARVARTVDVRSSGSPENRRLAARGLDQSFGMLPALLEPGVEWIVDPLVDVKAGHGHTLHFSAGGYFLLANNKLVPPEMGPRSYKDLEDPKFKGLILLSEPIGPSPGSRWAAYAWKAYGDEHLRKVIANVKSLTRTETEAPKQIARGEYGIYVHATQGLAADVWKLPKPHPFRLIVPDDGVMLLTGGINLLQGAPHPNAARVLMNYLLTRPAQQIAADEAGGPFIRKDVKPAVPELAHFTTAKPFPNNPDTFEFGSKLFFPWSVKAEPFLKQYGLK